MTCETALERILEASLEELSGAGDTPLASHLEGCARCRALADEVLEGQAALAGVLVTLEPRTDVDAVLSGKARARERSARRRWTWALPLAAAAAVAGLLLAEIGPDGGPVVTSPSETAQAPRRRPLSGHALAGPPGRTSPLPAPARVAAAPQRTVTLIATSNPRISVVWITPESD